MPSYKRINDYGLIGDMNSAALVGTDGSIDWCCFPRFDSPSVFAAMLDAEKGGRFQIAPAGPVLSVDRSYLPNTNILSTRFTTSTGELSLVDFMPLRNGGRSNASPHEIHRIVRCTRGVVDVESTFDPRLDYARANTTLAPVKGAVVASGNHQNLTLCTDVVQEINGTGASSRFTLRQGEEAVFVAAYGNGRPRRVGSYRTAEKLEHTRTYWESVSARVDYDGMWKDEVMRSFLVLQMLIYEPTGAVVAAPTTSLPESLEGSRNWDYRFAWLRDSSLTMETLYRMGGTAQATDYIRWLLHQCRVTNGRTRIFYGVSSNSSLKEQRLDHMEGYKGSRPVRIGNGAARHLQLDVFGEVILSIERLYKMTGGLSDDAWLVVMNFADVVCKNWRRKDRGVWEVRGEQHHFVYSKLMCWAALDRAVMLAAALGRDGDADGWQKVAHEIRDEVMLRGWSDRKQSFVQRYGSDSLDASCLVIPFIGFLPIDDPRVTSTIEAVSRELGDGPFVRRYVPEETDDGLDGEEEGAFMFVSFWLIGNLIYQGRIAEAKAYFEQMFECANSLGLFAEMINPTTGEFLGNFPQAYSHIGLIHTARNVSRALDGKSVGPPEPLAYAH